MGCWVAPYTTSQAKEIRKLMMEPFPAGIHYAADKLYNLIGDDDLFDLIMSLPASEDCRPTVLNFLQDWFGRKGDFVFDDRKNRITKWNGTFEDSALAIYKEMLTDWEENQRYPGNRKLIMTPCELATYVEGYLEGIAKDNPEYARDIFMNIFTTARVSIEDDGTFIVEMDG